MKGEPIYSKIDEFTEDFVLVRALEPNKVYVFIVGSVDGTEFTESDPREIETYVSGKFYFFFILFLVLYL